MIKLELLRFSSGRHDTLGILSDASSGRRFLCFTLEDEYRTKKVPGETRIPAGTYGLQLRKEGKIHTDYAKRFTFHQGMLWLMNVPNFTFVYMHIGNVEGETEGCPLLGDQVISNSAGRGRLLNSEAAYRRIYPDIATGIARGAGAQITVVDFDQHLTN